MRFYQTSFCGKKNIETNDFFDIDLQTETWEHLKEFYENNIEKIRMKQQE